MFIKFNGKLYNMTHIHSVIWFARHKFEEDEKTEIKDYVIQLLDKDDEVMAVRYFDADKETKWSAECFRIEQWLLGNK